eukprot:10162058-Prorocentrum_lima.AAC.1
MHYKHRNTPGEPESFFNNKKLEASRSEENSDIPIEPDVEHQLCSILEALKGIAFKTRPDISWAISRAMTEMNQR